MDVTVLTRNRADEAFDAALPYQVIRRPYVRELWLAHRRADVVILHSPLLRYSWPLLLTRRPRVGVVHGRFRDPAETVNPIFTSKGLEFIARNWLMDVRIGLLRNSHRFVAVSSDVASETGSQALVLHNGFRDDVFRQVRSPLGREPLSVAFMGRVESGKGLDVLLKALLTVRSVHGVRLTLDVIGEGSKRVEMQNLARELGLEDQVSFHGALEPREANDILNQCRFSVVPSVARESFGLTAIESQAAGCVVVASDIGGIPEAMGTGGVLVRPGDPEELASTLVRVIQDEDEQKRLVDLGAANAGAFSNSRMVEAYGALIAELVREVPAGTWVRFPTRRRRGRRSE